ncbi:MAG: Arc family DNA-binding protein [Bacteroidota bacterium]
MAKKKPFVLRVSPDTLEAVEKWAADEFRSTNGQIEWIIEQALRKAKRKNSDNNDNQNKK